MGSFHLNRVPSRPTFPFDIAEAEGVAPASRVMRPPIPREPKD